MFRQFRSENNGQNQSRWNNAPSQGKEVALNNTDLSQADYWLSQISVKLSGRLAATPVASPDGKVGKVELTFLTAKGFSTYQATGFQKTANPTTPERVLVWCNSWQFSEIARQINPNTRFEVQGKPVAAMDKAGKPQLVIVCNSLRINGFGRIRAFLSGKSRLAFCWALIFGAILILQGLLPRLVPPGLLPLAILVGGMRFVEQLDIVPDKVKRVIRSYLVKILLFAAFVAAIWFFVQYSYYTTARFR